MSPEPEWVRHAIWWRLYPLGAVGAHPSPASGAPGPEEHRLRRAIAWLDHAVELGASGIALGPIFASDTHGYDTLDHLRVDPRLGDEDDFATLVDEVHRSGLRLQLDGVFNHVSRHHELAQAARRDGPDSEAGRWFRWSAQGGELATFEGHEQLVVLDHASPEVQDHVVRVMQHWLDRGADAWRLDAAYAVPTAFWAAVLPRVRTTHPDVWFEAEVLHGDYAAFVAASTVDTVTQYELWKAIWSSINDRNLFELDWALRRHDAMLATFTPATFIGNHDVTRIATQIADPRHLAHATLLLSVLGGTPTVYAGDEVALHGVKEHRPGGDDAIRPELPADGPAGVRGADQAVLELHRRLIGLRRRHAWLHRATAHTVELRNEQYVIRVEEGTDHLVVALNLSDHPLGRPDAGPVLAADPQTEHDPGQVAPHGWAVFGPATSAT